MTENADQMAPDASPGEVSKKAGVRRVNNMPMYILGGVLLSFVLVMHGLLVVAGLAMFFLGSRLQLPAAGVVTVVVGVLVTAAWAAATATPTAAGFDAVLVSACAIAGIALLVGVRRRL